MYTGAVLPLISKLICLCYVMVVNFYFLFFLLTTVSTGVTGALVRPYMVITLSYPVCIINIHGLKVN